MDDLISRQAAIDALHTCFSDGFDGDKWWNSTHVLSAIEGLPSTQPEPCEDAVSRETILKFFDDWMSVLDENCHNQSVSDLKIIKRDFANLPSVTPKQRTGKWQITDAYPHNVYCSECHKRFAQTHWAVWEDGSLPRNFCPNCGAEMREVTQ